MKFFWMMILSLLVLVSCGKTEKKRRTLGYKGEAKITPFLAAKKFLEKEGWKVRFEHGLGKFDSSVSTMFLPRSSINTVGRAKRVLRWVEHGGHLVVMLSGGEMGGNDFWKSQNEYNVFESEKEEPGIQYLRDELGVKFFTEGVSPADLSKKGEELSIDDWEAMDEKDRVLLGAEKSQIVIGGKPFYLYHWSRVGLRLDHGEKKEEVISSRDALVDIPAKGNEKKKGEKTEKKGVRFLSSPYGEGRVTWLSDARPLRNRFIGEADHAGFLKALTSLARPGAIVFSGGESDGLFALLWRNFPLAIGAVLGVVILWLWRNLPRFGPKKEVPEGGVSEFSQQLHGVGRFLWRYQRSDVMLEAIRDQIKRQQRHHVSDDDTMFESLAEKSGLSKEKVTEAMSLKGIKNPAEMVEVVKILQHLRNKKK